MSPFWLLFTFEVVQGISIGSIFEPTSEAAVPAYVKDLEKASQKQLLKFGKVAEATGQSPVPAEGTEQPTPPLSSPEDEAAAKLAERRAEVEDVFHLKKKEPEQETKPVEGSEQPPVPVSSPEDEASAKLAERRAEVEDVFHLKKKEPEAETKPAEDSESSPPPVSSPEEDAAAKLAERRAEVEDVFHLKKKQPVVEETPVRKSKTVTMHDMPHYRNHGAAMYHVEPVRTTRDSVSRKMPAQEPAAKLAERRAEVEDVFHLSKKAPEPGTLRDAPAPAGAFRSRIWPAVCLIAALASFISIGYSKYEIICNIYEGKTGMKKFKAKQEDMDMDGGFMAPPRFAPQSSGGGFRSLSRRMGADTMGSQDFGV